MNRHLPLMMKTMTPLWTGGVEAGKMDRLHETAIIGSLRWWYEAVVRGLGGRACNYDDRGRSGCQFYPDRYTNAQKLPPRERLQEAGLCDVCQLFGATGWKRRFTVAIGEGGTSLFNGNKVKILLPSGRVHQGEHGKKDRAGGWFLMRDSMVGEIPLDFRFVDPGDAERMKVVLKLIEKHGALGGKKSSGYGVVRFMEESTEAPLTTDLSAFSWAVKENQSDDVRQYPDLRDLFFARIRFTPPPNKWWFCLPENNNSRVKTITERGKNAPTWNPSAEELGPIFDNFIKSGFAPLSPTIREWMRFIWGRRIINNTRYLDEGQENYLFGSTDNLSILTYRKATRTDSKKHKIRGLSSKIIVSHAYRMNQVDDRWEFRVWGWLPHVNMGIFHLTKRCKFLCDIESSLKAYDFASHMQGNCPTSHSFQFDQTEWMPDNNPPTGFDYLQNLIADSEDTPE